MAVQQMLLQETGRPVEAGAHALMAMQGVRASASRPS